MRVCVCLSVCQERQNEAHYLRQHRGELIEELAKTIVQKVSHKITRHTSSPCLGNFNPLQCQWRAASVLVDLHKVLAAEFCSPDIFTLKMQKTSGG